MSNSSLKDKLIEAAKAKQQADSGNTLQISKSKGCIIGSAILVFIIIIGIFIGKSFFMDKKGFDINSLSYASAAQIELLESVLQNDAEITRDHCIICRAKTRYNEDFGESYLLGTRIKNSDVEDNVLYCVLIGPKNKPSEIRTKSYELSPYLNCESCWPEIYKDSYHHYKTLRGSGFSDLSGYFRNHFDQAEQKTKGLFWSLYGLGKKVEVEE